MHIAPDDDGVLKIKQIDDLQDSKVYLEISQSMEAAIAAAQANK